MPLEELIKWFASICFDFILFIPIFKINDKVPIKELKQCIALALTYHRNKKLETSARWKMVENVT